MTQQQIVLELVRQYPYGIRTEEVKILSMRMSVSCPDRLLRYLAGEGKVWSERRQGDATKTWYPVKKAVQLELVEVA